MNGNSSDEVISNDNTIVINGDDTTTLLPPRDEMIIDIHHQDLKDPSVLGKGLFGLYDFVQTEDGADNPDSSLPPIGRSKVLYSKFSRKPKRPIITPKVVISTATQNSTTDDSSPSPSSPSNTRESTKSIVEPTSTEIEPELLITEPIPSLTGSPILSRETAIDSLMEYYSKFYSIVPNYGVGQLEKQFLQLFFEYMLDKNTEDFPSPVPMLRSVPLDIFHLYGRVLEKGGFLYMDSGDWELVFKKIRNYDELMKKPEEMLKSMYEQYLKNFEGFVTRQANSAEFTNIILEYIQKQNLEEFHSKTAELRKRILAKVRSNCEQEAARSSGSAVNNEKKGHVIADYSDEDQRLPMPELPKKLTKNILLEMQKSTKRAYLSFISKKGRSINLKIDVYKTPLGLELLRREPIIGDSENYGQLIYYQFDAAQISRDDTIRKEYKMMGMDVIEPGSLCYWMGGSSIIFGYGRTPKSKKQECRLTEKCLVFGKLNDPNYTFEVSDTNSSLYLPSVLHDIEKDGAGVWTVKLSSHPPISEEPVPLKKRARAFVTESPRKKVDPTPSASSPNVQKETPVQATTPTKEPSEPSTPVVIISPTTPTKESTKEIPKESPKDVDDSFERKILTLRYRYQSEDENSCKIATASFVAREYIDYSTILSLLRRDNVKTESLAEIRYNADSIWQILHENFKLKLVSNQTIIQILLFRKKY
ncbi:predicted protein [Naegleria gruberi]|uniref:Predicted protein n=1 Tax=Naegleria gruberi TaxID=5762 RepID=D2VCS4_NAEGR|nr:uncharacterized protein NAEGRDRAFT_66675 [Naegleria gruberi]EFC45359.1 predicted protein [Naegleria gruberi]|eukprot:XP_002678103.1 predicted protein [Naegleria gruberi strain NEG-M]